MSMKRVILEFSSVGSGSESSFSLLFHGSVLQFKHRIQLEQNQSGPSLKQVTQTVTESLSGSSPKVLVLVIHSQQVWTELHPEPMMEAKKKLDFPPPQSPSASHLHRISEGGESDP